MKKCKKKGCNNNINDKEKYCIFHKQQNVENGIKGAGGVAALGVIANSAWKHRDKIVKGGKDAVKFASQNAKELGKLLIKKF